MNDLICTETAFFFYLFKRGFLPGPLVNPPLQKKLYGRVSFKNRPEYFSLKLADGNVLFVNPHKLSTQTDKSIETYGISPYYINDTPDFFPFEHESLRKKSFINTLWTFVCNCFRNILKYHRFSNYYRWTE